MGNFLLIAFELFKFFKKCFFPSRCTSIKKISHAYIFSLLLSQIEMYKKQKLIFFFEIKLIEKIIFAKTPPPPHTKLFHLFCLISSSHPYNLRLLPWVGNFLTTLNKNYSSPLPKKVINFFFSKNKSTRNIISHGFFASIHSSHSSVLSHVLTDPEISN